MLFDFTVESGWKCFPLGLTCTADSRPAADGWNASHSCGCSLSRRRDDSQTANVQTEDAAAELTELDSEP